MHTLSKQTPATGLATLNAEFHGVRYLVTDLQRAIDFYTNVLGFDLDFQVPPAFATVSLGALKIHLSGPGSTGSRALPGGQPQPPGGSTRVILRVHGLPSIIESLRHQRVRFRNAAETGPGGRQIQIEDPDGNAVELFEPA